MNISSIYTPIEREMMEVEERLKGLSRVDSPWVAKLLGHVLENGGKRIRPAITLLSGKLYHHNPDSLVAIATAVEVLHTATLVHDDAVDSSLVRRGKPTVSLIWGEAPAVLLGDYLFASAAHIAASIGNMRVTCLFAQTIMTMSFGELGERFSAYNWEQSREQYYQRIRSKTASLFSAAAELGAILSDAPEEAVEALRSYGYNLGMAFQIVDDVLDFIGDEEEMGKPVGSDLLHGTLTLPAILLLEHRPEDNPIRRISKGRENHADVQLAIDMILDSPIIDECYGIVATFRARACQSLEKLPPSPYSRSLFDLAQYVVKRRR